MTLCLLGSCRISVPGSAQLLGGLHVYWGRAKTLVGKPEHSAAKGLAFPGGGKGVPVPSSTAADPHHGDEVRNVGLLGVSPAGAGDNWGFPPACGAASAQLRVAGLLGQGWHRGAGARQESVHIGFQGVEGVHEVGSPWGERTNTAISREEHPEAVDSTVSGLWWAARAG